MRRCSRTRPTSPGARSTRSASAIWPPATTGIDHWSEVLPHRDDVKLDGVDAFAEFLLLFERADALRRIRIMRLADGDITTIEQPEEVYTAGAVRTPSSTPPRCASPIRR